MFRNHCIQFISVALKHYFDLDHNTIAVATTVVLVIWGYIRLLPSFVGHQLGEGMDTVKSDWTIFAATIAALNKRWKASETYELAVNAANNVMDRIEAQLPFLRDQNAIR